MCSGSPLRRDVDSHVQFLKSRGLADKKLVRARYEGVLSTNPVGLARLILQERAVYK